MPNRATSQSNRVGPLGSGAHCSDFAMSCDGER